MRWAKVLVGGIDVNEISFARALEDSVKVYVERELNYNREVIKEVLKLLRKQQSIYEKLLDQVQLQLGIFPEVSIEDMMEEKAWTSILEQYSSTKEGDIASDFVVLTALYALIEKTAIYYNQAAFYNPYPAGKHFYSALSHIKHGTRRRVDAIRRVNENKIWEKIGFAPYSV